MTFPRPMRRRCSARASPPTMLCVMPRCGLAIWLRSRASAAWVILASSSRGAWGSVRSQSRGGREKKKLATELGAHSYINSQEEDAAMALQRLGGARVILATAASTRSMGPLLPGLAARGRLIMVGASPEPIEADPVQLIFGGRSIEGSLTGTAIDAEDVLSFSVLENIRPMIETVPLEQAANAYSRMMEGKARFRMVLTTGQ